MANTCPNCRRELFDKFGAHVHQNGRQSSPSDDLADFIVPDNGPFAVDDSEYVDSSEGEESSDEDDDDAHVVDVDMTDVETVEMLALEEDYGGEEEEDVLMADM